MSLPEMMKKLGRGTTWGQSSDFGDKAKMSFKKEECEVKKKWNKRKKEKEMKRKREARLTKKIDLGICCVIGETRLHKHIL